MYNILVQGIIKFFTSGYDFIELKDNDDLIYRIGSQKPAELFKIVNQRVNSI